MDKTWKKIKMFFSDRQLRNRFLFVLGMFVIFRLLATIVIPGVDEIQLQRFLTQNSFFGLLNVFSGGGLAQLSMVMLGVGPYITASIIMQLLTVMFPNLKAMYQDEGEIGRRKFSMYTRYLAVPMAYLSGFGLMVLLEQQGVLSAVSMFEKFAALSVIVAGSMLLLWIGELISEFGLGNGVSLIIFAGIAAAIPTQVSQFLFVYDPSQLPTVLLFGAVGILMIALVVFITEAERPIPVTYARFLQNGQTRGGGTSYIPIRINQAGVMPIIFALSILLFPQFIGNFLKSSANATVAAIGTKMSLFTQGSVLYMILYFVLVFVFTYFYTAVTFDPKKMASNLQKNSAFIPGIRPGEATESYVGKIVGRITFIGGLFLAIVAIIPLIIQQFSGITTIAIGGTALLIVVSVIVDLLKKADAQLSMKEY